MLLPVTIISNETALLNATRDILKAYDDPKVLDLSDMEDTFERLRAAFEIFPPVSNRPDGLNDGERSSTEG
jgi:hypothetical protein